MEGETYVSFETAKLLKEKGFNERCYACYVVGELSHYDYASPNNELIDDVISAPTQQMARRWLRTIHSLHIEIRHVWLPLGYKYCIILLDKDYFHEIHRNDVFESYEDAVEAAIQYCLTQMEL